MNDTSPPRGVAVDGSMLSQLRLAGRLAARDLTPPTPARPHQSVAAQRDAALSWMCRAQDATPDGGVSAGFHLKDGWLPSYPETSGYIACTFLDLADALARPELARRAWRMIDWLLTLQFDDGGFPGQFGTRSRGPIVFNTGQILLGLVRAAETDRGRRDVYDAALRAARWLVAVMDSDGCWRRYTHEVIPHSYNSRTAWALLRCGQLTGADELCGPARGALYWTISQQESDGYVGQAAFGANEQPYLHTIAYAVRGLFEGGLLLGDAELVEAADLSARPLALRINQDGGLAGAYAPGWRSCANYRCLTGEAQMAIIWARLYVHTGESLYLDACASALRFIGSTQRLDGDENIRGAIAGSYPIWGRYSRFEFPNWAAKFFVDALHAWSEIRTPTSARARSDNVRPPCSNEPRRPTPRGVLRTESASRPVASNAAAPSHNVEPQASRR